MIRFSLVFVFILANLSSISPIDCPAKCQCKRERNHLDIVCRWTNILTFPHPFVNFPHNQTQSLKIVCSSEKLRSEFRADLFAKFPLLTRLNIEKCHSSGLLPAGTFRRLSRLRSLHLDGMVRGKQSLIMENGLFSGLSRLEKLTIIDSHLETINERLFCPLKRLQQLDLSFNRLRTSVVGFDAEDENCRPSSLVMLNLSGNQIERLVGSDLRSMNTLRVLSLAGNRLDNIDDKTFENADNIQDLDLGRNRLVAVSDLPEKVLRLNLAENSLTTVPESVAVQQRMIELNLSTNNVNETSPFSVASKQLERLDLSNNKFARFPTRLLAKSTNLTTLLLDDNQISTIEDGELSALIKINRLNLNGNRLVKIGTNTLFGMDKLARLEIAENSISEVSNEAFDHLSNVKYLDLSENVIEEIPFGIRKLYRVEFMDLSRNRIRRTYKFLFNKLPFLRRLDLHGNKLRKVEDYIFSDIPRLTHLNLSGNRIENLTRASFDKCPQLTSIDLSNNSIGIPSDAFVDIPQLTTLNLTANLIVILDLRHFPPTLTKLSIAENQIRMSVGANRRLSNLKNIDLSRNNLHRIADESLPNRLETANLSGNSIARIDVGAFARKSALKWLDLRFNRLEELNENELTIDKPENGAARLWAEGNRFQCSCRMDWIKRRKSVRKEQAVQNIIIIFQMRLSVQVVDLDRLFCRHFLHNTLLKLDSLSRSELLCPYEQVCSQDCPCCRFASCDCKNTCPLGCHCFHDAPFIENIVQCAHLDDPEFSPKTIPMYASRIYLDHVRLPLIRSHDFLGRFRLRQLHINHSDVETIQPRAFTGLASLEVLDLSGNSLAIYIGDELENTPKLRHLFLSQNRIEIMGDKALDGLPDLQAITLHSNRLPDLPMAIDRISDQLYSLTLGDNPFRCDCNRRFRIQKWLSLRENRRKIFDMDRLFCTENITTAFRNNDTTILSAYPPNIGTDLYQIPYQHFEQQLEKTICLSTNTDHSIDLVIPLENGQNATLILITSGVLLSLLVMFVVAALTVRKVQNSREVQHYKSVLDGSCGSSTTTSSPLMAYDLFVSYSKLDETLVEEQLCRPLEADDYTLCMLYRDQQLPSIADGLHIVRDDLIAKMRRSQCLLLVLTQNFLDYEWQTVQIRTAHQCFVRQDGRRKLLVILGDDLKLNELDPQLGHVLRTSSCIRWKDPMFWQKLTSSMPRPKMIFEDACSAYYSEMYGTIVPSHIV